MAACPGEDFLAQALHREYRHVPDALAVAGLMTAAAAKATTPSASEPKYVPVTEYLVLLCARR
jgi:hypothetical protein